MCKRIWVVSCQCSQFLVTLDILNTTDTNTSEQYLMYSHFYLIKVITIKLHILITQTTEQLQHLERNMNTVNNSATYGMNGTKRKLA